MAAISKANAQWEGTLTQGKGEFSLASGIVHDQQVTWAGRTERMPGTTSPEELLAGAHASCYAMAFSNVLTTHGTPPTQLQVSADVTFVPGQGITTVDLHVRGRVPGVDQATFAQLAREGEQGCPVSNALRNNVRINLEAQLDS